MGETDNAGRPDCYSIHAGPNGGRNPTRRSLSPASLTALELHRLPVHLLLPRRPWKTSRRLLFSHFTCRGVLWTARCGTDPNGRTRRQARMAMVVYNVCVTEKQTNQTVKDCSPSSLAYFHFLSSLETPRRPVSSLQRKRIRLPLPTMWIGSCRESNSTSRSLGQGYGARSKHLKCGSCLSSSFPVEVSHMGF